MGAVTDVDLKRNSRGRSRHFAFIGFHNDRDADEAIRLLNHTFINTNKIQIDRCSDLPKGINTIFSLLTFSHYCCLFQMDLEESLLIILK